MKRFKRKRVLLWVLGGALLLSSCSAHTLSQEEQRAAVPYSLSGRQEDWEIRCEVRELTAEEKTELSGTQTASAEEGQWYASWQTEGDLFIPPLAKAAMIVEVEGETLSIPLELSDAQTSQEEDA